MILPAIRKCQFFHAIPEVRQYNHVSAVVVPHAGYRYSGQVAAAAYNQVDPAKQYNNIFILAPSHHQRFAGASIYSEGDYLTPLGRVRVNRDLARKLMRDHSVFRYNRTAHIQEHSLEVQLPFLQHHLEKDFQIVPILTGTHDIGQISEISSALKPYFKEGNLFVVSTDFSHYPTYRDAQRVDAVTADAVVQNQPDLLMQVIRSNARQGIDGLATSMCGWPAMLSLLNITGESSGEIEVQKVLYRNSGDITGDSSRVVGYWALAFIRKQSVSNNHFMDFHINQEEKRILLGIARRSLKAYVSEGEIPDCTEEEITQNLKVHTGAFVTLYLDGELRGCIGRFNPAMPLYQVVRNMAVASCSEDMRFPPVSEEELDNISIEISVLTPLRRISSSDEIQMGRDGVYIRKGPFAGTLLPQVAQKTGWTREEFLGHCARDKAGIGWKGWEDAEVYTYQAIVFNEAEINPVP
mgnify:CR=1 FL=1